MRGLILRLLQRVEDFLFFAYFFCLACRLLIRSFRRLDVLILTVGFGGFRRKSARCDALSSFFVLGVFLGAGSL